MLGFGREWRVGRQRWMPMGQHRPLFGAGVARRGAKTDRDVDKTIDRVVDNQ